MKNLIFIKRTFTGVNNAENPYYPHSFKILTKQSVNEEKYFVHDQHFVERQKRRKNPSV
jgi:hypothetical protein